MESRTSTSSRSLKYRLTPRVQEHFDAEKLFQLTNKNAPFTAIKKAGEKFFHRDTLQCAEREYKRSGDNTLLAKALEAGLKKRSRSVHNGEKINAIMLFHKFPLHANSHKTPSHWDQQCEDYTIFDIEAAEIYAQKHSRYLKRKGETFDRLSQTSHDKAVRKLAKKIADRDTKSLVDIEHIRTHFGQWQRSKHEEKGDLAGAVAAALKTEAHAKKALKYGNRYAPNEHYLTDPDQKAREHNQWHHNTARSLTDDRSEFMEYITKRRTLAQAGASGRSFS